MRKDWCALWAQGDVSEDMAALWTVAIVHPFWRDKSDKQGEGKRKLRPIACSEALTKVAESTIIDIVQGHVDEAMRPLGCGVPGGAALVTNWPDDIGKRSKEGKEVEI